jgi:hypothetical protein
MEYDERTLVAQLMETTGLWRSTSQTSG